MAELRTDWLTGRTVILAENRALRPNEFESQPISAVASSALCPFCPGQESLTPPAVYSRNDDQGRWQIRVVPNKFPAIALEAASIASPAQPAMGVQEVIIESARHVDRMSAISVAEFAGVSAAYRERLRRWHDDGRLEYGLVFKNVGAHAGASLAHVHSQLLALPQLPPSAAVEWQRAEDFFGEHGSCAYCDMIQNERTAQDRIVFDHDGLIAFCPYASLQPYEVWLMPTEHEPWFERPQRPNNADNLAEVLHALLVRVERVIPRLAYNLLVRTAPWSESAARAGHWRIEILPRVNSFAGLELATGIHINPLSPARAAAELRSS